MRIAERLYSQGFISYPRTETNIFPNNMNLNGLVEMQTADNRWGREYYLRYWYMIMLVYELKSILTNFFMISEFACKILGEGISPRQGKKSDQAHPPIHPIKHTDGLSGNFCHFFNKYGKQLIY